VSQNKVLKISYDGCFNVFRYAHYANVRLVRAEPGCARIVYCGFRDSRSDRLCKSVCHDLDVDVDVDADLEITTLISLSGPFSAEGRAKRRKY